MTTTMQVLDNIPVAPDLKDAAMARLHQAKGMEECVEKLVEIVRDVARP